MLSLDFNTSERFDKIKPKCSGEHCRNLSCNHGLPKESKALPGSCPVCFEEEPDTVLLPCSHKFHGDCILQWVEHNFSCPMCRQEIAQFYPLKGQMDPRFVDIWNKHYLEGSDNEKETFVEEDDLVKKPTQTQTLEEEIIPLMEPNSAPQVEIIESEEVTEHKVEIIESEEVTEHKVEIIESESIEFEDPEIGDEKIEPQSKLSGFAPSKTIFDDYSMRMFLMKCSLNLYAAQPIFTWKMLHNYVKPAIVETVQVGVEEPHRVIDTFDNLRSGACSGILTTAMRLMVERGSARNLYPILREVTPNVAIYFTVYEEMKKYMGRPSDSGLDIFKQCFCSGFIGGFCAYLPAKTFSPLVPLQFGLHFGIFEVAKQQITNITGRERLNVVDVGSTAVLGGALGSCVTYPLRSMYANFVPLTTASGVQIVLTKNVITGLFAHCIKMSPLWATTAVGFDFSRRFITNT